MKEILCRLNFKFSAEHGKISLLLQKTACRVLWSLGMRRFVEISYKNRFEFPVWVLFLLRFFLLKNLFLLLTNLNFCCWSLSGLLFPEKEVFVKIPACNPLLLQITHFS
jgi:hypothetical protein